MAAIGEAPMRKSDADFTRRMLLALASAVADQNHQATRAIVETLAKEHRMNLPADWNA